DCGVGAIADDEAAPVVGGGIEGHTADGQHTGREVRGIGPCNVHGTVDRNRCGCDLQKVARRADPADAQTATVQTSVGDDEGIAVCLAIDTDLDIPAVDDGTGRAGASKHSRVIGGDIRRADLDFAIVGYEGAILNGQIIVAACDRGGIAHVNVVGGRAGDLARP